jgi:hypothetical protein
MVNAIFLLISLHRVLLLKEVNAVVAKDVVKEKTAVHETVIEKQRNNNQGKIY